MLGVQEGRNEGRGRWQHARLDPCPGGRVGVGGLLVDPGEGAGTLVCSRVVTDKVHLLAGLGAASSSSASLEPRPGGWTLAPGWLILGKELVQPQRVSLFIFGCCLWTCLRCD